MPDRTKPTVQDAWDAYMIISEHINNVGMVHSRVDDALRLMEDFLRIAIKSQNPAVKGDS